MIIDFKEIAVANKGGQYQDLFEQFACDFLESVGYKIIRRPDRGPDGKKDLIISESRVGINGETTINWLVSCKHNAHSNKSVNDTDEQDIYDRVLKHNCQGFLGFYSTITASSLSDKLNSLGDRIEYAVYDASRIERDLLLSNHKYRLLASYFPNSLENYKRKQSEIPEFVDNKVQKYYTEDEIIQITTIAISLSEIEKIKWEDYGTDWITRNEALNKLYRFNIYSSEKIAASIFKFLLDVSHKTRAKMPSDVADNIHSLVFTFLPSSYDDKQAEQRLKNGKKCIDIGFNLVYDSITYLKNYRILEFGLSIWKNVYLEFPELSDRIIEHYKKLENDFERINRNDINYFKDMILIFKEDLNTKDLAFPILPEHIYKLIEQRE